MTCLHQRYRPIPIETQTPMQKKLDLPQHPKTHIDLSVGLGDTLQLILLLDGVGVAASLGSVDQLLSQALSNRLDVSESGFTGTDCEESDGLVDTAERGDIDGLTTDSTG